MSPKNTTSNSNTAGGNHRVLKVIGITIVALALVGLVFSSFYTGGSRNIDSLVFGSYGGKDIVFTTNSDFAREVRNVEFQNNTYNDPEGVMFEFNRFNSWMGAFNTVAVKKAKEYYVEDSGYAVSSRAIDRGVVDAWSVNGVFDEESYKNTSQVNKQMLRDELRQELTVQAWNVDSLTTKYRSDAQVGFLADMGTEQNTYRMVSIPFSSYPDDEVIAYAASNSDTFESLALSRINVSDEETADTAMALLEERSGEISAFADVAREYSRDDFAVDGGFMGDTYRYRLAELVGNENADEIFATAEGSTAGPFETDYGWMIYKVDGSITAADTAGIVEDIRNYMTRNEVGIIEEYLLARADAVKAEALSSGDIATAAANAGYEVITTGAFPVNYGASEIVGANPETAGFAELAGSSRSDAFWNAVVPLVSEGQISDPVVMSESVGIFSLDSTVTNDANIEMTGYAVDYYAGIWGEQIFESAALNEENGLFENNFADAYFNFFEVGS